MFNLCYVIAGGVQLFGNIKSGAVEMPPLVSTDCSISANCTVLLVIQELKNTVRLATHFYTI